MNTPQIVFLLIVAATLALFISERVRIDVAAMLTLLALAFTGILTPAEALSGFASEPAIIVASVFVVSAAMSATGLTERIGNLVAGAAGHQEWRAIVVIMPTVAVLASLSHHLMITAMMLPILMRLARERNLPASRLLMPMSLAASLGTTLTLFSAPALLLTNNLLKKQGNAALDLFSVTPVGAALIVLSVVYMSLGRWLLPRRGARTDETSYLQLSGYYTELVIESDSIWIGRTFNDFQTHWKPRLRIVIWLRHGTVHLKAPDAVLEANDVFVVHASPDELASIESEPGVDLHAVAKYSGPMQEQQDVAEEPQLVQVVVAPHSPFAGRSIAEIDFLRNLNVVVVGLWRKQEWFHEEMSQVRLREGDLLVLRGAPRTFAELNRHHGFLMMVPFEARPRYRHRAWLAVGIIAVTVGCAAANVIATQLVFLAGAVALVVTRCVSVEQAYREIDVRIYVMIAGVVPLGLAMEKTGTAAFAASYLEQLTNGWSSFAVLLTVFWSAALLTQVLSDAATAVLLVPIAVALAHKIGLPPAPFALCTALGAVTAFLTPIGHHGNLLILSPGRYRFGDFIRVGVPLTVLISLVSAWVVRQLWLGGA